MKLRQLPQLYLRGAMTNETMRNLTGEERDEIATLTEKLAGAELMAGHKFKFVEKLCHTIGGDYLERETAEQEFSIVIWRALVYLIHHREYTYECGACGAKERVTQKNKRQPIDRRYPICPVCSCVRVTKPGDSEFEAGSFVKHDDLQAFCEKVVVLSPGHPELSVGQMVSVKDPRLTAGTARCAPQPPAVASPITPIRGTKKVPDHNVVLEDPQQMVKYLGEFIWNYMRQTLRENKIKQHNKDPYKVCGPADQVAVDEINSLLTAEEARHRYDRRANPIGGAYRIVVEILATNRSVSADLRNLIDKYADLGVSIGVTDTEISVSVTPDAPQVEAQIITPQPVCIQGQSGTDNDDDASVYDVFRHSIRNDAGRTGVQEDGILKVETDDMIVTIRESLSDSAQKVYDIMTGRGETYEEFCKFQSGNKASPTYCERPRNTHIADFMGTTTKQVGAMVRDIKVQCLAHGIGR